MTTEQKVEDLKEMLEEYRERGIINAYRTHGGQ
jgi:hypothetical protein